jgi:hypothetical protein
MQSRRKLKKHNYFIRRIVSNSIGNFASRDQYFVYNEKILLTNVHLNRTVTSETLGLTIVRIKKNKLQTGTTWLFELFPEYIMDTTVDFEIIDVNRTCDYRRYWRDAARDSTAQIWPYSVYKKKMQNGKRTW